MIQTKTTAMILLIAIATIGAMGIGTETQSVQGQACTGKPQVPGSTGDPHDAGDTGNPHDMGRFGGGDSCHGAK